MPLTFEKQTSETSRLAVWNITEEENEFLGMLPLLNKPEEEFLKRISYKPRRLEWLASRVLIYNLTGLYPETRYNDNGQPFVSRCSENISISHTRNYAAIALSKRTIPGVDIEQPSPRIKKVSSRFLNEVEKEFISDINNEKQVGLIWCAKEAIFKKTGQPGLIFKEQILVDPFVPQTEGSFSAKLLIADKMTSISLNYRVESDNYYLVWTD